MENEYILWSAAMQGWATNAGTYGTELKDAKRFTRHDALARCILHFRKQEDAIGLLPVRSDDVAYITDKQP